MEKYTGKIYNQVVRSIIKIDNNTGKVNSISKVFRLGDEANKYWCDLIDEIDKNSFLDVYGKDKEKLRNYSYDVDGDGNTTYYPFTVKSSILGVDITFQMLENEMMLPADLCFE